MRPKFELVKGAAAWEWPRYERWLTEEWGKLLGGPYQGDEKSFQMFLERHPCLLPGGDGIGESFGGHHGSWGEIVITEPPIPGISARIPDFMWLTKNSAELIPVLIEIEAPAKRWLTKKGDRTADFVHAEGQLADWRRRLDDPTGRLQFADLYDFPAQWAQRLNLAPRFMLIYGRRSEFGERPEWNRKRGGHDSSNIDAMTYDRLRPLARSANVITVKIERKNDVVTRCAVAVPPTFQFGPSNASSVARIRGLGEAISANDLISQDRRQFLLSRLEYWQDLGRREIAGESLGIQHPATDWE